MSYISREMVRLALRKMREYHESQSKLHEQFGIDFLANSGRRNIIMSHAQEHFFAQVLSETFRDVRSDGRTGEADIFIGELGQELECKITSPHESTNSVQLQTDYATLERKGSLDYLYVIVCPNFKKFCVLHFEGLTIADFRSPSPGARGKSRMIKHFGMQKCNVLAGDVVNLTEKKAQELGLYLESLDKDLEKEIANIEARRIELESYLKKDIDPKDGTKMKSRQRCSLRKKIKRAYARPDYLHKMFNNRRQRVRSELRTWQNKPGRFTFVLEPLTEE